MESIGNSDIQELMQVEDSDSEQLHDSYFGGSDNDDEQDNNDSPSSQIPPEQGHFESQESSTPPAPPENLCPSRTIKAPV